MSSTSLEKTGQSAGGAPYVSRGLNIFDEMEKMFEGFSTRGMLRPFHWDTPTINELSASVEITTPSVDVINRDGELIVKANMPGVEKKDIDISLTKNTVTIKGEKCHKEKEENEGYYRCEISKGSYQRTITLPAEIDDSKAKAKFKDGVLELTLPKVEVAHRHNIKVE